MVRGSQVNSTVSLLPVGQSSPSRPVVLVDGLSTSGGSQALCSPKLCVIHGDKTFHSFSVMSYLLCNSLLHSIPANQVHRSDYQVQQSQVVMMMMTVMMSSTHLLSCLLFRLATTSLPFHLSRGIWRRHTSRGL